MQKVASVCGYIKHNMCNLHVIFLCFVVSTVLFSRMLCMNYKCLHARCQSHWFLMILLRACAGILNIPCAIYMCFMFCCKHSIVFTYVFCMNYKCLHARCQKHCAKHALIALNIENLCFRDFFLLRCLTLNNVMIFLSILNFSRRITIFWSGEYFGYWV